MTSVISIANQKGGVGKTTTAVNLAAIASLLDWRVLVIDNDPQGNASSVLVTPEDEVCFYLDGAISPSRQTGIDCGPSSTRILRANDHAPFQRHLERQKNDYQLVIIDCPPSLNRIPLTSFAVSDLVLIPIQCEYYAMEGLSQILDTLSEMNESERPRQVRILLTMFDERSPLCRDVAKEVREYFPRECLKAVIPRDHSLAAAPSHNQSIIDYDPLCVGSLAYLECGKELFDGIRS